MRVAIGRVLDERPEEVQAVYAGMGSEELTGFSYETRVAVRIALWEALAKEFPSAMPPGVNQAEVDATGPQPDLLVACLRVAGDLERAVP